MTGIECMMNLLPIICADNLELGLINKLNNFFNFDQNLFLLDSSADIDRFVKTTKKSESTPQSLYVFKSDVDNISGLESLKVKSKNSFLIDVPENVNFEKNLKLLSRIKEIQGWHLNLKIGIFFSKVASSEDIKQLFEWSWQQRIINIFIATYSSPDVFKESTSRNLLNIFTYNPFGKFHVINLTGSEEFENLFLKQNSNFQQHPLYLRTSYTNIWQPVARLLNASWITNISLQNNKSIIHLIDFKPMKSQRAFMYPLCPMRNFVMVVPEALPYSELFAYLRTLTDNFVGYIYFTIAAVILALSIFRYKSQKKYSFIQSVVDVLNLLMNDNTGIQYQKLSRIEVFLVIPLTFSGLIIVNGYLSAMQSYVTRPILQPQIKTMEDLYNSKYPVEAVSAAARNRIDVLESLCPHGDWSERIVIVEPLEHMQHIFMYNTSISFLLDVANVNMLLENQKRFNIRGYSYIKTSSISLGCLIIPFKDDFPFSERVNEIIQRLATAGLWVKWLQDAHSDKSRNWLQKHRTLQNHEKPGVESFQAPMFICYGWIASIIVLIIEIISKYSKLSSIISCVLEKLQAFCTISCENASGEVDVKDECCI